MSVSCSFHVVASYVAADSARLRNAVEAVFPGATCDVQPGRVSNVIALVTTVRRPSQAQTERLAAQGVALRYDLPLIAAV